jgi:putative MATE family efflux protein
MLVGNVFQQFYNMVDSIVVGQFVGKSALAAVSASFPVLFLMLGLIMGITMGSTILIAQFFGARQYDKVRVTIETSYIVLFIAGIFLSIVGFISAKTILTLLSVPADVMPEALQYLQIIYAGMLLLFGYNAISAILRGLGDSKTPMYLLIAATLLNVVLDLVFVVVFKWGIAGAAWATVIAQGLSFIGVMLKLNISNELVKLDFQKLAFNKKMFWASLRLGLPTGIQQSLVGLGMSVLSSIVNAFGTDVMAGYGAASKLDTFASMPAMNLSQALSTFVGQNMGAGKPDRVKRGHISAVALGTVISIIIGLSVVFFGKPLMQIFTNDEAVIAIGARYLYIVGLSYFLFSTMFINNGVMRGAGDVMIPMINTLLALWLVRLPMAAFFSTFMGSDGIWWSIPAGWLVGAIFSTIYYLSGRWKLKAMVKM